MFGITELGLLCKFFTDADKKLLVYWYNDDRDRYYKNMGVKLKLTNEIILYKFYPGYYNHYSSIGHYGQLYKNRQVYYKFIQSYDNYLIYEFPHPYSDTFKYSFKNNTLTVDRTDVLANIGWGQNLKINIIDKETDQQKFIVIGSSTTNIKVIHNVSPDHLRVYDAKYNKLRLGSDADGGYVICDLSSVDSTPYDCYISCGVSDEESFSRDFINKYNMNEHNSYAFDGTINSYPYSYTNKISFIKKNINSFNDNHNTNMVDLIDQYENIFLKMDIEGWEYPWLSSMDEEKLKKFKQIVFEFHGINDDSWNFSHDIKINCFKKIELTHYLVHAHGNNHSGITNNIPDVIELTYINKKCFENPPETNTTMLPLPYLDQPCCRHKSDYHLNFYPFVNTNS